MGERVEFHLFSLVASLPMLALGCDGETAPARAQLVVIVDTDAPAVGQLVGAPDLSPDAAVDTLRIDVIGRDGEIRSVQEIAAVDASSWPISFGVVADGGADVTLRVRAFRGRNASSGTAAGVSVLEPARESTIDRLASIPLPSSGVHTARIVLHEDCIGSPASFLHRTTCVDADRREAAPTIGVENEPGDVARTRVGTWGPAREAPCGTAEPRKDTRCIPGGFTLLGDLSTVGLARGLDAVPLLPVVVSPFWLDTTEVTVGRFRTVASRLRSDGPIQRLTTDPERQFCTYLGPADATNDDLPLSCVTWEAAKEICSLFDGTLPSEAEWEHAARGRGQGRRFPWGNTSPACCTTSAGRESLPDFPWVCPGKGVERVGSHPAKESCGGLGDISRDGVLDLGGSLEEWTLDTHRPYDHPCWGVGLGVDHVCTDGPDTLHTTRGGTWAAGPTLTLAVLRATTTSTKPLSETGFRCRYPGRP